MILGIYLNSRWVCKSGMNAVNVVCHAEPAQGHLLGKIAERLCTEDLVGLILKRAT